MKIGNNKKKGIYPEKHIKRIFKRKIRNIFDGAGFTYIPTNDKEMSIGHRKIEIDSLFIYENIWIMCEDTIATGTNKEHIRTKNEATREIKSNLQTFIKELIRIIPDKESLFKKHTIDRIKLYSLYIPKEKIHITHDDELLFSELKFIQPKTLDYFHWIVQCIKYSAKNEIFRFLNIKSSDVGPISSLRENSEITSPIIYPKSFTGLDNKVRIVSFMISAEDLLNTCYVLRKESWSESIWLYQRLIDKRKINNIRSFIDREGAAFYNNIIVGLPDCVRFKNCKGDYKKISEINDFNDSYQLILPKEYNSICVIDGQHRIFAHYESGSNTKQEKHINNLKKELHLLVTGLVFPEEMPHEVRSRIQSKIFLDINTNAKPVPQSVLLHIQRIQNPISDESIAQFVVEKLNSHGVFQNMLQISSLDKGNIKTASIVKYALRYLVSVNNSEMKESLFKYWTGNKELLKKMKQDSIEEYVTYCHSILNIYFSAIKKNLSSQWNDAESKILSVISINGFIIALTRQLCINGVRDFEFYDHIFKGWSFDFSKKNFEYTSSQYRKFSTRILKEAFKIDVDTLKTI